jgi:site-specific DNA recombinase
VVDAIATIGVSEALRDRLKSAESERERLSKVISVKRQSRPKASDFIAQYIERVNNLKNALEQDVQAARDALREILGPIRVVEDDDGVWAEIDTNRAIILRETDLSMRLVAGARFELTTFGL